MASRAAWRGAAAGGLAALLLAGCAAEPGLPDLATIYARVAEAGGAEARRPLITVPGTLGSRLRDTESGALVWGGGSRGLSADPDDPAEAALIALPIPGPGTPIAELRDSVVAAGILDVAAPEVFGIPLDIEVYGGILRTLSAGGFRSATRSRLLDNLRFRGDAESAAPEPEPVATPEETVRRAMAPAGPTFEDYARIAGAQADAFRFDYDWRRDIPALAAEFHRFVMRRKRQVAAARALETGRSVAPESVTFDLLAHSMGGLVVRYYLMHGPAPLAETGPLPPITWEGARHFHRVVIVATPNAGSILAMDNLVNGKTLGPLQPFYPAALLATHVSPWQLFPRARHRRLLEAGTGRALDPLDPALWERHRWGLLDPAAEGLRATLMPEVAPSARLDRARAHQARLLARAARFQAAMDRWAPKPEALEMFLVVGGGFATPASAEVDPATGALALAGREEGDGVVLRASVLLDERQGREGGAALETPLRFDTTLFLPDEHVELTKNPVFGDNLLFWLLEQPRDAGRLAEPRRAGLAAGAEFRAAAAPAPEPGAER